MSAYYAVAHAVAAAVSLTLIVAGTTSLSSILAHA